MLYLNKIRKTFSAACLTAAFAIAVSPAVLAQEANSFASATPAAAPAEVVTDEQASAMAAAPADAFGDAAPPATTTDKPEIRAMRPRAPSRSSFSSGALEDIVRKQDEISLQELDIKKLETDVKVLDLEAQKEKIGLTRELDLIEHESKIKEIEAESQTMVLQDQSSNSNLLSSLPVGGGLSLQDGFLGGGASSMPSVKLIRKRAGGLIATIQLPDGKITEAKAGQKLDDSWTVTSVTTSGVYARQKDAEEVMLSFN